MYSRNVALTVSSVSTARPPSTAPTPIAAGRLRPVLSLGATRLDAPITAGTARPPFPLAPGSWGDWPSPQTPLAGAGSSASGTSSALSN